MITIILFLSIQFGCLNDFQCPVNYICKGATGPTDPEWMFGDGRCVRKHKLGDYVIKKKKRRMAYNAHKRIHY